MGSKTELTWAIGNQNLKEWLNYINECFLYRTLINYSGSDALREWGIKMLVDNVL